MKYRNNLFTIVHEKNTHNKVIININYFILISFILITWSCQHARVRIIPDLPRECLPWSEKQQKEVCQESLDIIRNDLAKKKTIEKEYPQDYTYWGFRPDDVPVDLNKECPKGVFEIYQYSTLKNAIYEQFTIGFYSPITLKLTCYE